MQESFRQWKSKGAIATLLPPIILLLLGTIAVLGLIWYFFYGSGLQEQASETACHDSLVFTQALMKQIPGGEMVKEWPVTCKTEEKTLEQDNRDVLVDRILEMMGDCWYMMGEGKLRPFDTDWLELDNKCFVCYTFSMPNAPSSISSGDLVQRLATKVRPDGITTYAQYLNTAGVTELVPGSIAQSQIYAIYYSNKNSLIGEGREHGVSIRELNAITQECSVREAEES